MPESGFLVDIPAHNLVPSVLTVAPLFHHNPFNNSGLTNNRSANFSWHVFGNLICLRLKKVEKGTIERNLREDIEACGIYFF
jgi:hypothetical protein